jgi:alanine dehydrogenase
MLVGVPKEIKPDEYRVGLIPSTIKELVAKGHKVLVEATAGDGAGIGDSDYVAAGATVVGNADEIFGQANLIVKVKEPLASERSKLQPGQLLFTYLHLAADPQQAHDLLASGVTALAYETITAAAGKLPLLAPMSAVAGRMSPQVAAYFLERPHGGRGILLGAIENVPSAKVLILGSGIVARNAAQVALGMGATVTIVTHTSQSSRNILRLFGEKITAVEGDPEKIDTLCRSADVVVGAALVAGAAAPKLIGSGTVAAMQPGTIIIDVSIDQGGCAETSRATTHSNPTYVVNGVIHYCVTNMPGAVPRTSTFALNNATRPFILELAEKGFPRALLDDPHLLKGLNIHQGKVTCRAVADALRLPYTPAPHALAE